MKISTIMTTRNRKDTVLRAIQSVKDQSVPCELIVVDDCSTDGTEDILREFIGINYYRAKVNIGSTEALNKGLSEAHGKYICVLDDDDYWTDEDKLKKQSEFLDAHPEVVVVGTNGTVLLEDRTIQTSYSSDDETLRENALLDSPIAHVTSMYRAPAYYDTSFPRGKDWDLFLRLGLQGKFANLPDNTTVWQDRKTNRKRATDSYWKLRIIWRHRRNYPHGAKALSINLFRLIAFSIIS